MNKKRGKFALMMSNIKRNRENLPLNLFIIRTILSHHLTFLFAEHFDENISLRVVKSNFPISRQFSEIFTAELNLNCCHLMYRCHVVSRFTWNSFFTLNFNNFAASIEKISFFIFKLHDKNNSHTWENVYNNIFAFVISAIFKRVLLSSFSHRLILYLIARTNIRDI